MDASTASCTHRTVGTAFTGHASPRKRYAFFSSASCRHRACLDPEGNSVGMVLAADPALLLLTCRIPKERRSLVYFRFFCLT
eukprot:3613233-Pleurochrysis_carterae.AAC.2